MTEKRVEAANVARVCMKAQEELVASLTMGADGKAMYRGISEDTKQKLKDVGVDPDDYIKRLLSARTVDIKTIKTTVGVNRGVSESVPNNPDK